jgi:Ala-tRNA(Pro) deacylase
MLDRIVRYLHDSFIPFRLASYPSMEHLPKAAHPIPKHAMLVESQVLLVDDKLVLACYPANEHLDVAAFGNELGGAAMEATMEDLPESLQHQDGPPPPLGQLYGIPIVIDEAVTRAASIVFQPFGESDFIEIPYDDFARQEQPRVASFTRAGELTAAERPRAAAPAR